MTVAYNDFIIILFSGLVAEVIHVRDVLGLESSLLSFTFETLKSL
jgi:hypothetical protein